jgi:hypothetical protein
MEAGRQEILEAIITVAGVQHQRRQIRPIPTIRMLAVARVGISRPLQVLRVGGTRKRSPAMHRKAKEKG